MKIGCNSIFIPNHSDFELILSYHLNFYLCRHECEILIRYGEHCIQKKEYDHILR